jgi:amino acid adenylation domain-containing protein
MTAPERQAAARRALLEQRIKLAAQRASQSGDPDPQENDRVSGSIAVPPQHSATDAPTDISPRQLPLAVSQRSVWWFAQLAPEAPVYNEVALIVRRGPLDVAALEGALRDVVARHEAWRTSFAVQDGEPVQIVHPSVPVELPRIDVSHLPAEQAHATATARAAEHARRPYDLEKPPLLRALLVKVAPDEHRLYLALHHLIFDGVSLYRVALPELIALYGERTGGPAADLASPAPYADFVAWERAELARPAAARHLDFHRRRLAGVPLLDLPLDRPRPVRQAYQGAMEAISVPPPVVDRLRSLAGSSSATLFQVLAAAYAVVLGRFSGQDDLVFGTATDLRRRPELYPVVGMCVSSSVLRVRLDEDRSFADLVTVVRDELADLIDHPVPFDELIRELAPERDQRMHPLFQAGFVFEPPAPTTEQDWTFALMEADLGNAMQVAKFDLHLEFDERPTGELAGRLVFNTDLFDRETARRITRAILLVLDQVVADPSRPVAQLTVVPEAELIRMVVDWNAKPPATVEQSSLLALLETQGAKTPNAIAIRFEGREVTYRELHESANALAERLAAAGARVGTIVGLGSERSIEMVVGLLAILKTGAAYLPMDPALPRARLRYMAADAQLALLLLDDALLSAVGDIAPEPVAVIPLSGCLQRRAAAPPGLACSPTATDTAYVLYTSGSTGTPKAVVVPHKAAVSMLTAYPDVPGFAAGSRFLATATLSFDIAAAEIWLPLVSGERVVLATRADTADPKRLAALIRDEGITNMQGTPTAFQMLVDSGWEGKPELTVLCGGEHMPATLAEQLSGRCRLWNGYGPTETTVFCTAERIHGPGRITVGRPIANARAYILDRRDRPVPVGVTGELHIAGGGVADGYLNRPELTAQRFVPEYRRPGETMYRTGDLARYLPDGRIELLGRTDEQIKIRGHRVELGEIESAIADLSGAEAVVVMLREDQHAGGRLVAYLVPAPGERPVAFAELRRRLSSVLPGYMVPAAYVALDELPKTTSGKVDRLALPAPAAEPALENADAAADVTPFELQLARLWARVLGVDSVGVEADFWAIGGHSLLAVRLVAAIETELGISMSVAKLIEGDVTVRALAARLPQPEKGRQGLAAASEAPAGTEIVHFNSGGDLPPLMMFFPSRESFLAMRLIHVGFDARQPLVGLLAGLDANARFRPDVGMTRLAEQAVETLKRMQPPGAPYRIAGYSMAGLIAYEVAGLLLAQGEEIEWLGLIDTYSPETAAREFSIAVYLERSRGRSLRKSAASALARVRTESIVRYTDFAARVRRRPLDRFDEMGARRLMRGYAPTGHKVPLDLFVTEASSEKAVPMLGWSQIHDGPVQMREILGDHMSIMQGDSARRLADALVRAQPSSDRLA